MKTRREHRVPLSKRALEVLNEVLKFADGSGLVFPSPSGRTLSDSTISKLIRENGIPAVPHGFRSSFRNWCGDTGAAREVAEACLAHTVKGVEGAYFRSDLFARRRELMGHWANYIRTSPIFSEVMRTREAGSDEDRIEAVLFPCSGRTRAP